MRGTDKRNPRLLSGTRTSVTISRFDGTLRLAWPEGGPLARWLTAFVGVWGRIPDADVVAITRRWREPGRVVPRGMAPVVFVQADVDWSKSVLPQLAQRSKDAAEYAHASGYVPSRREEELLGLYGLPPAGPHRLWTCFDDGRQATFSPLLVTAYREQTLETAIASWLACTYVQAVGHAQAAKRRLEAHAPFRRRETEPLLHEIDCGRRVAGVEPDVVERCRANLLAVECRLYLSELWSG